MKLLAPINPERLVQQLGALAQDSRLAVMRLLVRYRPFGLPAGDIARLVAVPHNTMSTHLAVLEKVGLVRSRREGRMVIFAAEAQACEALVGSLGWELTPPAKSTTSDLALPVIRSLETEQQPYRVLVLCTANSARSLMAEALINREGKGRFEAISAGSRPATAPHPEALRLLAELGYDTSALRPKSWRDVTSGLGNEEAVLPFDLVITVCDSAAGEPCPALPGNPLSVHWGIADPAGFGIPEQRAAVLNAYRQLAARLTSLINLPVETMDSASLKAALSDIARLEGATPLALERSAA